MEFKLQKPSRKLILPLVSATMMASSLGLVWLNQSQSKEQFEYLVTKTDLAEGHLLSASDVTVFRTNLKSNGYLTRLRSGQILSQSLLAGQYIPKQALGLLDDQRTPIRLSGLDPVVSQLSVGDRVNVWASPKDLQVGTGPEVCAFDAIVTKIERQNSMGQIQTDVELRVSIDFLESILNAKANGYRFDLILSETLADQE